MQFVVLSQHLRELRYARSGRPMESAMRVAEVWEGALASELNAVKKIILFETEPPQPFDGLFVRYSNGAGDDIAEIYVRASLPKHWKEFVVIKELMHCWSPEDTWTSTSEDAANLVTGLNAGPVRYAPQLAADTNAIHAAAEVILPHYVIEHEIAALQRDYAEIANGHGLHPEIGALICQHDRLHTRKNGCL